MKYLNLTLIFISLSMASFSQAEVVTEAAVMTWFPGVGVSCGLQTSSLEGIEKLTKAKNTLIERINDSSEEEGEAFKKALIAIEKIIEDNQELYNKYEKSVYISLIVTKPSKGLVEGVFETQLGSIEIKTDMVNAFIKIYGEDFCAFDNDKISKKAAVLFLNSFFE